MKTTAILLLLLTFLVPFGAVHAKGEKGKEKDRGRKEKEEKEKEREEKKKLKEFLKSVGKSLKAADSKAVATHFKPKGKIELKLKGQRDGEYRAAQAKGILKSWCEGMEPSSCELKEVKGLTGKFKLKYKIEKNGKKVEATIKVHLEKAGETWRITGIVES